MKKSTYWISLVLLFAAACENSGKQKDLKIIADLEKHLFADSLKGPRASTIDSLLLEYSGFAQNYPKDSLAPLLLFKAGELCISTNQGQKALGYFDQVFRLYPEHEKAAYALFMKGFIYDGPLADTAKARAFYTEFLQKYPQHPLTADAQFSIRNLGKSDDDLIREFEARLDSSGQKIQ